MYDVEPLVGTTAYVRQAHYILLRGLDYWQLIHILRTHDCISHESIWE